MKYRLTKDVTRVIGERQDTIEALLPAGIILELEEVKEEKEIQAESVTIDKHPNTGEWYLCVNFPVSQIGDVIAVNKAADHIKKVLINKEWEK